MDDKNIPFDIYVINLDKDTERLEKIQARLSPNEFTRIPGIYGNGYDYSNDDSVYFTCKHMCPKSVIGCAKSHHLALKTFLETSNKEYVLILEDDAEPLYPEYINKIIQVLNNAPDNWDIIKLDWVSNIPKLNSEFSLFSWLTTAYLINKDAAEQIINKKIIWHYDFDINFYGLNIYTSPEIIFKQTWNKENNSNNRKVSIYPNSYEFLESMNFKILRIGENEYSWNDLIYFLLFLILIIVLHRTYPIELIVDNLRILSTNKTK
jgi:GR25 family glycosyltransferase involved in LPS biosynthesis